MIDRLISISRTFPINPAAFSLKGTSKIDLPGAIRPMRVRPVDESAVPRPRGTGFFEAP
jgi:hypothetical protein